MTDDEAHIEPIAIIGIGLQVPGATTLEQYWANICGKVESVTRFSEEELRRAGVAKGLYQDPAYVRAACVLPSADLFDAEFFGITPSEAAVMDPQHRLFLECAWQALEDAGHDPNRFDGSIGVYGGCFMNRYLLNLYSNESFLRSPMAYFARHYNDKDFLATNVAYRMNLRGPAVSIQTACSTSLVATHFACQALHAHDCDLAIAGGVAIPVPLHAGYMAMEGTMASPDGRCLPFDADARGTLPGSGVVLVALRRLRDALADGDDIRAVIRGTAINNDGRQKASFTAPNPEAQVQVIVTAQTVANVHPDTIGYVEAHATGTKLGDPIEVAALTEAFRHLSDQTGFCALGSIKANIGHLDAAAGTAGLVRAVLALEKRTIPPQANYTVANPELKLAESPFYVPTLPTPWPAGNEPRRAGVSSFAVGGTNAHAVLEEAPERPERVRKTKPFHLLVLSARDGVALDALAQRLAEHLSTHVADELTDVATTLALGRAEMPLRRSVVGSDRESLVRALRDSEGRSTLANREAPDVVFMFPGVGTQYPDMALDIYESEPSFRGSVDTCAALLREPLGMDIRSYLFPARYPALSVDRESVPHALAAIFTIEYALAQLWLSWGVRPVAALGHSLGEYVAACVAGVLSLKDALHLTVRRGRIFDQIPQGRMMSVALPEQELLPLLDQRLSLGAVNAAGLCLVSGKHDDLEVLRGSLEPRGVQCRMLRVRMASHSYLVEPHLEAFTKTVAEYELAAPKIPYLSCLTGTWITAEQATSPAYWARQLRAPVQFAKMIATVTAKPGNLFLEVGPGNTLSTLACAQHIEPRPLAIASMRHPQNDQQSDLEALLSAVGRLWEAGIAPSWPTLLGSGRRVRLPTYPFQRKRFWIEGRPFGPGSSSADAADAPGHAQLDFAARTAPALVRAGHDAYSPEQRAIAEIWCAHLGVSRVGLDDDIESLGGHSLLVAQMLGDLQALFSGRLQVRDVFGAPTVRKLAALLKAHREPLGATATAGIELAAEVVLDPSIRPDGLAPIRDELPKEVLLTGATGFLGAHILAELLKQTTATVHCLVRAADRTEGERRIRSALHALRLPAPQTGRLVAVPGDLKELRFGLAEREYRELSERVAAIHHCGAWVNFARPYSVLKPANVIGTEEVLRFATQQRLKAVHFVSTLFVTMGAIAAGVPEISEDDPLPPPIGHATSYTESKWVAEALCRVASQRGVPVAIYRPGDILGAQHTGATNAEHFFTKAIQGCVQLGMAPRRAWTLPVGTVDDVAKMIVKLSTRAQSIGHTHHLVHPEVLQWNTIFTSLRQFGYELPIVSWDEWRAEFARRVSGRADNALAPLADMIAQAPENRQFPRFGVERTAELRTQLGMPYPEAGPEYFANLFRYMIDVGLLPPPPRKPAAQTDTAKTKRA
ncbi:MAG: Thioester reductase protein [Myxococcaceae bacterium]|nr:Thioester reductase protein [Myxococcaceae bacterium]